MSVSVCVYVCLCLCECLSVRDHFFGITRPTFTKFFVHITFGRGSVFSGGVVIRYVLPVLWMTSYLLISQACCSTSPPS